jgi:glycosyltransferase involved in cell wall biosynthesis
MPVKLSIVLITRNQEWNIRRLIESVLRETKDIPEREVVLVDSASTDDTVKLAADYPIHILRLKAGQRFTAAAGRYVGYRHTTGDLVLFLDGDMELQPAWLLVAVNFLLENPTVAVVSGQFLDLLPCASSDVPQRIRVSTPVACNAVPVQFCGGAGMYRRSVLEQVGPFNPYLYSDEEPDLCLRVRMAGYSVVRVEQVMVNHYTEPGETFLGVLSRWRRNLYLGTGQNLRYKLGTNLFWPYLRERGYAVAPGVAVTLGIASMVFFITSGDPRWLAIWLLLLAAALVIDVIRRRSIYRTTVSVSKRLLVLLGTVRGFLDKPLPPATYPCSVELVKTGPAVPQS